MGGGRVGVGKGGAHVDGRVQRHGGLGGTGDRPHEGNAEVETELGGVAGGQIGRSSGNDGLARRERGREGKGKGACPTAVGGHRLVAEEGLALAEAGGIGGGVGEELDAERRAGHALQRTADGRAAAGVGHAGENGERLVVVRVVGAVEKDAQAAIVMDGVAEDAVTGAGVNGHAVIGAKSDGVAGARGRAADGVVISFQDIDSVAVAERDGSGLVRADEVALDKVVRAGQANAREAPQKNAIEPGNHIARAG